MDWKKTLGKKLLIAHLQEFLFSAKPLDTNQLSPQNTAFTEFSEKTVLEIRNKKIPVKTSHANLHL